MASRCPSYTTYVTFLTHHPSLAGYLSLEPLPAYKVKTPPVTWWGLGNKGQRGHPTVPSTGLIGEPTNAGGHMISKGTSDKAPTQFPKYTVYNTYI